jgi:pyrroloquinoline-quinone synthase
VGSALTGRSRDEVGSTAVSEAFVSSLRARVETHPAVHHPFLTRFGQGGLARWQIWGYASQHYHLVRAFPAYLEAIAHRTPDPEVRRLLREVLEDEYVRPQHWKRGHDALYRRFMRAVGFADDEWETVPLLPATRDFVRTHLDLTLRSWLQGLGAVGPGHEWAIPIMFPHLVRGIERSVAIDPEALEYFHVHIDKDVEHGRLLEACLRRWSTAEDDREQIRRGAEESLAARAAFWSALLEELFPPAGASGC